MIRARILVVDDKDNIVKLLARVLSAADFDVTTAPDGTRALALVAAEDFDVVLSDIRMPGADGMAILQETRRLHPETEVILMTAFATVQAAVDAMKQGAYDYLQKPFEPDEAVLRRVDIPLLAAMFVQRHRREGQPDGFAPEVLAALIGFDWPGNVRQLENMVQRALAVSDGAKLTTASLLEQLGASTARAHRERLEAMPTATCWRARANARRAITSWR